MQNKTLKLLVTFLVLFSLQGFSQTTENSTHPLLDKYYPQKKAADTNKTVTTQINPVPVTKPLTETKPVPATKPVPETQPIAETKPGPETTETKPVSETKPIPAVTDTTAINKPTNTLIPVPVPVPKKVQTRPATAPYNENRLGSSSPQYDTWEKNNNGAGSVTTSPK
jgi:outer membrane biosynthesis protein TonB